MRRPAAPTPFLLLFGLLLPVVGYQLGAGGGEAVSQFATTGFLLIALFLGGLTHVAIQRYATEMAQEQA